MTTNRSEKAVKVPVYWSTILLGLIVAAIFLIAIFSYQVQETERALVITMGKITGERGPGLHLRLPLPIQEVVKYDIRQRCFDGNTGALEETMTQDEKNVIVGIYAIYSIKDLARFKNAAKSLEAAEEYLSNRMRTVKGAVIGKYRFDQMINIDPKKMMLHEIETDMFKQIAPDVMARYGLEVVKVGVRTISVPAKISAAITERMKKERETAASIDKQKGKVEAEEIKTLANEKKREAITNAEATAKKLMAEGDAEAAMHFAVFNKNPELAAFLRKLESLKRIVGTKTTLVLGTDSVPFDIFTMKVGTLEQQQGPVKTAPAK
ncbi:MAG: Modulator of FtsH protease HflC [Lentisphaerae bacterium ADurb.Bin242]|nr:MAG: Modulator of FtsH protease HflC [Lentisphaerae bacterium ADurb.Bin242]